MFAISIEIFFRVKDVDSKNIKGCRKITEESHSIFIANLNQIKPERFSLFYFLVICIAMAEKMFNAAKDSTISIVAL